MRIYSEAGDPATARAQAQETADELRALIEASRP